RVCAGNPRGVSRAIKILSFQNFYEVLKTCSAGRKDFFDTLASTRPAGGCFFLCARLKTEGKIDNFRQFAGA
ncbi:hypothetical protein, partial [Dysosmobacter sp.]|uniref:hypothetical protein n=1 Tax=Dysosmobacter sp. TaxID=2591382 RepID=UPI003AF06350